MTDAISLALSTGLGPVVAIVIILALMGLVYKMAGRIPAVMVGIASTLGLMYLDFLPVYWGIGIIFALVAGLAFYWSRGEWVGD